MSRLVHVRAAVPWSVVLVGAIPGLVLVVVGVTHADRGWAPGPVRWGLLLLAVPMAFLLDDPAAGLSSSAPRSPWWDLRWRLVALAGWCLAAGAVAWWWSVRVPTPQPWVLGLLPACAAVAGVGAAATMRRSGRDAPGDVVAGVAACLLLGLLVLAPRRGTWELLPTPGSASPTEAGAWLGMGLVAVIALLWSAAGRGRRPAVDA